MTDSSVTGSGSLDPLPPVLQHGLPCVCMLGFFSFLSSALLFLYLSRNFVCWFYQGQTSVACNQFLLLLFQLVIADMHQGAAYLLNIAWITTNKIDATSINCHVQGWFVSTGDLASGCWIFAIALHTLFAVVKGRRVPTTLFWTCMAGLWVFIYGMAIIGLIFHPHGFYVRAGAWCWIAEKYSTERLLLHYLWIFIFMFGSIVVYSLIYCTVQSQLWIHSRSRNSSGSLAPLSASSTARQDPKQLQRAAKYMVLYPLVYVICTLPLAAGRMAAIKGITVTYWYYCFAGSAISCCGWLDVLLYACTRRVLVFSDKPPDVDSLGFDTFGILNSSGHNLYGMTTSIEGGLMACPVRGHRSHGGMLSAIHSGRRTSTVADASQGRNTDTPELFNAPVMGVITTKTTIEISSRSMTDNEVAAIRTREGRRNAGIPGAPSFGISSSQRAVRNLRVQTANLTPSAGTSTSEGTTPTSSTDPKETREEDQRGEMRVEFGRRPSI